MLLDELRVRVASLEVELRLLPRHQDVRRDAGDARRVRLRDVTVGAGEGDAVRDLHRVPVAAQDLPPSLIDNGRVRFVAFTITTS